MALACTAASKDIGVFLLDSTCCARPPGREPNPELTDIVRAIRRDSRLNASVSHALALVANQMPHGMAPPRGDCCDRAQRSVNFSVWPNAHQREARCGSAVLR